MEEKRPNEMEMAKEKDEQREKKEKNEEKMSLITEEKILKYFDITKKALKKAKDSKEKININNAKNQIIEMVENYLKDAEHFYNKKDFVNAFAALNYSHGWLDCGASLGIFDVHDSSLFTVD